MRIILYSLFVFIFINLQSNAFSQSLPCEIEIDSDINSENIEGFISVFWYRI